MAVNVKMGVDIGGFTSGIKQGQQILKGLNAEMKASEAEFKATGNAEQKLNAQTKTLNSQLNVQRGIADQARKALQAMTDQGIDPADAAYQKLYVQMLNAEAGASEAQAALQALGTGTANAATGAEKLANGLSGISKKMSLDQVISGIDTITGGLEKAAQKAIKLGEEIWNSVMDSARWADDTATQAQMFGIDLDEFQKMQGLVKSGMDTNVEAMLKSQKKLRKGIGDESKAVMDTLAELNLAISSGKDGGLQLITDDQVDLYWKAGQALMNMSSAYDKESAAQTLFGRSWEELVPLFSKYKTAEDYQEALDGVNIVSEESVENLAALNDKMGELEHNFNVLKTEVIGQLAPALTGAADALNGLLQSLLDYLKTDDGKKMLQDLGTAVSGLFEDLKNIDPEKVVEGFTGVFSTVVSGVQWISDNWEGVVTALEGIVIGWGALKLTGGILEIVKLIQGVMGLGGAAASAATAGAEAGASWGTAFAGAVIKAAPWLVGLYTLLNPAGTAGPNIDQMYANGQVTEAGWEHWKNNPEQWNARLGTVGNMFGDLGSISKNAAALNIIGDLTISDEEVMNRLQNEIGLVPVDTEPVVPENAAESISEQVGTVYIPIEFEPTGRIRTPKGWVYPEDGEHANGLWSVPYDGYLARLHKGERVMPAREVSSRNYSSNLYVESMYMNGGTDAAGLASAMAAAQRRQMSGYGS